MIRTILPALLMLCASGLAAADRPLIGINLAGAEFAPTRLPGVEGGNYAWPTEACIAYWHTAGIRLIRLPFLWERLQPELMHDFDPAYAAGLARTVALLRDRGMQVILDVHNYGRYRGKAIGSPEVPAEAFHDLWARLAAIYKDAPNIWGYGLMNEPGKGWREAAQHGIDGIRSVDARTQILVANDYPGWAATRASLKPGTDLAAFAAAGMAFPDPAVLSDPAGNLRWEVHTYFDHDASGTYRKTYEEEITRTDGPEVRVRPETGIHRIAPFVAWLELHHAKGLIGEYSAPANPGVDPRWMDILDRTLAYMQEHDLPSTYWAGGQAWSPGHAWCIEPSGWAKDLPAEERLRDRPQLGLLRKYMDPTPR